MKLRLVRDRCSFCGAERDPADLTESRITGLPVCRTNIVTCVNRATKKKAA